MTTHAQGKTMIHVDGLTKHYGKVKAVNNISFDVHAGEVLGFLGPNGAGKTTTCLLYTSPSPRDRTRSRMPSSA